MTTIVAPGLSPSAFYSTTTYLLPAPSGGDDTAAWNATLAAAVNAGGARVQGRSGAAYTLAGEPVIGSNTVLDVTGCTINTSNSKNALRNAASMQSRFVSDAVTTAGSTTLTSATAAFTSADVGKAIQVVGAGPNAGKSDAPGSWYGTVISVTSATAVVLSTAATLTTTGKTAYVYPARDVNISVIGGDWICGERSAVSQTQSGHCFRFRRVDGLKVFPRYIKSTRSDGNGGGGGYAVSIGDAKNIEAGSIYFNVGSDGVHVQGPAQNIDIHDIAGFTGDDLVAFTGVDGQTKTGSLLGDVEGDITDVHVARLTPVGAWTALKVTSGTGTNGVQRKITRFLAENIVGTVLQGAVNVVDYAGTTWFDGSIKGVNAIVGAGLRQVYLGATYGQTISVEAKWDATMAAPTAGVVAVGAGRSVSDLTVELTIAGAGAGTGVGVYLAGNVDRFTLTRLSAPGGAATLQGVQLATDSSTYRSMSLNNIDRVATAGNLLLVSGANVTLGEVSVSQGGQSSGSVLAFTADTTSKTVLRVSNWRQLAGAIAIARGPMDVHLSTTQIAVTATAAVQAASDAATPIRVTGSAGLDSGTLLSRTGSQVLSVNGPSFKVDYALLTEQSGDQGWNTNSAVVAGIGPTVTNGTTFTNILTGTSITVGTPNAPTGVTVGTPTASGAPLSWTAPTSTGGAAITDYAIRYRVTGATPWTTFTHTASTATSNTITGLSASTGYDVQVAGVNSAGTGTYSATATFTTAAAPAAGSYKAAVLQDSPTALWMLDEASGTAAADSSGNSYNGTGTGTMTRGAATSGPGGAAMTTFGGGYFSTATLGTFGSTKLAGGVSVEFLWRGTTTARGVVCGTVNTGNVTNLVAQVNASFATNGTSVTTNSTPGSVGMSIRAQDGTTRAMHITANIFDGNVHHVVLTLTPGSSGAATAYVDGTAVTATVTGGGTGSATFADFGFPMGVGANNGRGTFDTFVTGDLGGVAIYGAVLTATRASAHRSALVGS